MSFGLTEFKTTPFGQILQNIIGMETSLNAMIALSTENIPAAQVIGKSELLRGVTLTDQHKQFIGRLIREAMEAHDWTTDVPEMEEKIEANNRFKTGAVYYKKSIDS